MLGTADYSIKMPISEALTTAIFGMATVVCILALIALCVMAISKVIQAMEKKSKKDAPVAQTGVAAPVAQPQGNPLPETCSNGSVELIDTDERTAAVIMAIVSNKSGIPLNRLDFKSIRLMEDK